MCLCSLRLKNTLFFTYCKWLLLYAPPFWNASLLTKLIVLRTEAFSDWPAIWCVGIGRIPHACDGNVNETENKTIKPIINETFVASRGNINTYNNDVCWFFMHCVAPCRVNITMSAFVIGEKTNYKHYSTLLKTHIWIVSRKFFNMKTYLSRWVRSVGLSCWNAPLG